MDFSMVKLSVIVTIYNIEDYIRECIDSILNQKYKDIEVKRTIEYHQGDPVGSDVDHPQGVPAEGTLITLTSQERVYLDPDGRLYHQQFEGRKRRQY